MAVVPESLPTALHDKRSRANDHTVFLLPLGFGHEAEALQLTKTIHVGRSAECELRIDDAAVSRRHARLDASPDAVRVTDLGSSNGVFVNARRVEQASLENGACLRIGDALFVLRKRRTTEKNSSAHPDETFVGGPMLDDARRAVRLVSPTDLPVMLLGETGTGKEVVARRVHEVSGRKGAFVALNVAAVPVTMFENELFGHTSGAYTGANRAQRGLFVTAHRGTLFLDEIGDLSLDAQAKLLRVLEDGKVRPVGGDQETAVDVRVVCATNRNLEADVNAGRFRADLFARLAAVVVSLPPLRARAEDVPALVAYLARRRGIPLREIEPDALEALLTYAWPQNVRELDNCVKTATLHDATTIKLEHLPEVVRASYARAGAGPAPVARTFEVSHREKETPVARRSRGTRPTRQELLAMLGSSAGNLRKCAESLGISRAHLYRVIAEEGLSVDAARTAGTRVAQSDATQSPTPVAKTPGRTKPWKRKPS